MQHHHHHVQQQKQQPKVLHLSLRTLLQQHFLFVFFTLPCSIIMTEVAVKLWWKCNLFHLERFVFVILVLFFLLYLVQLLFHEKKIMKKNSNKSYESRIFGIFVCAPIHTCIVVAAMYFGSLLLLLLPLLLMSSIIQLGTIPFLLLNLTWDVGLFHFFVLFDVKRFLTWR